jgi:hypothetical protein
MGDPHSTLYSLFPTPGLGWERLRALHVHYKPRNTATIHTHGTSNKLFHVERHMRPALAAQRRLVSTSSS